MNPLRFTTALKDLISDSHEDIHTALPCKIVSVNYGNGTAQVAPLVKNRVSTEKTQDYPNLSGVPLVVMQGGGVSRITFPVKAGDTGVVIFSERDPSVALAGSGSSSSSPVDLTTHGLFPIGFMPISVAGNAKAIDNKNVVLENDKVSATFKPAGDVVISNSTGTVSMDSGGVITLNTGSSTLVMDGSSLTITASGGVNINGLTIDSSGQLTDGNGIIFQDHKHTGVEVGLGTSGGPTN